MIPPSTSKSDMLTALIVCSIARESILPQSSSLPEAPQPARLCRLPRLPTILEQASVPEILDVPGPDTAKSGAFATAQVSRAYHQPAYGAAVGGWGDEGSYGVASRSLGVWW